MVVAILFFIVGVLLLVFRKRVAGFEMRMRDLPAASENFERSKASATLVGAFLIFFAFWLALWEYGYLSA